MISLTALALMNAAAEELEVIDSGGTLTTKEQASMLLRLQGLIDSSNLQKPLVFSERINTVTLTGTQQKYTIGIDPTGTNVADFPLPRPVKIDRANLFLSATVRRPVDVLTFRQWSEIRYQQVFGPPEGVYFDDGFGGGFVGSGTLNVNGTAVSGGTGTAFTAQLVGEQLTIAGVPYVVIKVASGTTLTLATTAGIQNAVAWSAGNKSGMGTLYFYLIPDQNYPFEFYTWHQNQNVTTPTDLINYAPGYADYWLYGLVIRSARMFGRAPASEHIQLFSEARNALLSQNCPSPEIASDPLLSGRLGLYNWLTGENEYR